MSNILKFSEVMENIIALRGQKVILDSDVAALYGVETRDIGKRDSAVFSRQFDEILKSRRKNYNFAK